LKNRSLLTERVGKQKKKTQDGKETPQQGEKENPRSPFRTREVEKKRPAEPASERLNESYKKNHREERDQSLAKRVRREMNPPRRV